MKLTDVLIGDELPPVVIEINPRTIIIISAAVVLTTALVLVLKKSLNK